MACQASQAQTIRLTLFFICFLCGLSIAGAADLDPTKSNPFHPYRKVGDRYYDLRPIYDWMKLPDAQREQRERPLKEWVGLRIEQKIAVHYEIVSVAEEGLLLQMHWSYLDGPGNRGPFYPDDGIVFLKNYPYKNQAVEKQNIEFLALKTGTHQYQDAVGARHTVALYDYGVPYDPQAKANELAEERSRAIVRTAVQKNIATLPLRMDGVLMRLTDYEDQASLHRIKTDDPNLTLSQHRLINENIADEIRSRGGSVEYIKIKADDYFAWLKQNSLTNNAGNRAGYIEWLRSPDPKTLPTTATVSLPK